MIFARVSLAIGLAAEAFACSSMPELHDPQAAAAGDAGAAHRLCFDYTYGERGLSEDGIAARKWCAVGARLGHPSSQTLYAQAFEGAFGGPMNLDSAAYWYHRAALQQHPHAQYALGYLYLKAAVPFTSETAAESLLRASSAQGYEPPNVYLRMIDSVRAAERGE
jgi:TPR repeat protein